MENPTKEEREKLREQQFQDKINKEKSKKLMRKILYIVIPILIVGGLVYAGISSSSKPGEYDDFAKCLTENNIKEYGAFWCSNCAEQKKMFGKSFEFVNYIECDARGNNAQPELCQQNGIRGYPTWIIDGEKYEGVQSLENLAQYSGCSLNS